MKERISLYQTALLLTIAVLPTSIVLLPAVIVNNAGRDGWISAIILILLGFVFSYFYTLLIKRMGSMNFIEFNKKILGKWLTTPLVINLIVYFIMISGVVTRQTAEIITFNYLPLTPLWFINLNIILIGALFVFYGLETMGRTAEILVYLFYILFFLIIILIINDISLNNLRPFVAHGIKPVLKGIYPGLIFFSEIFIILFWSPNIKKRKNVVKSLLWAIFVVGFFFVLVIFLIITLYGESLSNELTIPLVTLIGYVSKLEVFERMDPFVLFFWIGGGIGKMTMFMYGAVYTLQKFFNTSTNYLFTLLVIPPIFYFSFYYFHNFIELNQFVARTAPYFVSVQVLYPLIIYIISLIRGIKISE